MRATGLLVEGDRGPGAGDARQIASVCLSAAAPPRHTERGGGAAGWDWGRAGEDGGLKKASIPEGEKVSPMNTALANKTHTHANTRMRNAQAVKCQLTCRIFPPADGRDTDSRLNHTGTRHQGALAAAFFLCPPCYINLPLPCCLLQQSLYEYFACDEREVSSGQGNNCKV